MDYEYEAVVATLVRIVRMAVLVGLASVLVTGLGCRMVYSNSPVVRLEVPAGVQQLNIAVMVYDSDGADSKTYQLTKEVPFDIARGADISAAGL